MFWIKNNCLINIFVFKKNKWRDNLTGISDPLPQILSLIIIKGAMKNYIFLYIHFHYYFNVTMPNIGKFSRVIVTCAGSNLYTSLFLHVCQSLCTIWSFLKNWLSCSGITIIYLSLIFPKLEQLEDLVIISTV